MKKGNVLVLSLCALMIATGSVFGTMAYFTSSKAVTNTFTIGEVKIELDEARVNQYGQLLHKDGTTLWDSEVHAEADKHERVQSNDYKLIPGHTYVKDPTVTVSADSESSYVRMLVTVNKKSALDAIGIDTLEVFKGYDADKWPLASQKADGDTMVYEFRYYQKVSTADTEEKELEALFDSIVVPSDITGDQLETLEGLEINVAAHAMQADGFADTTNENGNVTESAVDKAWKAFGEQSNSTPDTKGEVNLS